MVVHRDDRCDFPECGRTWGEWLGPVAIVVVVNMVGGEGGHMQMRLIHIYGVVVDNFGFVRNWCSFCCFVRIRRLCMRPLVWCPAMYSWPHFKCCLVLCWCVAYYWPHRMPFTHLDYRWPYSPGQSPKSFAMVSTDSIYSTLYRKFWYFWGKHSHPNQLRRFDNLITFFISGRIADTLPSLHCIRLVWRENCCACGVRSKMSKRKRCGASKCRTDTISHFHISISCGSSCCRTGRYSRNCTDTCSRCERRCWANRTMPVPVHRIQVQKLSRNKSESVVRMRNFNQFFSVSSLLSFFFFLFCKFRD